VNPFAQFFTSTDYLSIIPAVQLALFGCAILLFDAFEDFLFGGPQYRRRMVLIVVAAEVFAGIGLWKWWWVPGWLSGANGRGACRFCGGLAGSMACAFTSCTAFPEPAEPWPPGSSGVF